MNNVRTCENISKKWPPPPCVLCVDLRPVYYDYDYDDYEIDYEESEPLPPVKSQGGGAKRKQQGLGAAPSPLDNNR